MGMCALCGRKLKKTVLREFRYMGFGADNVYLEGVNQYKCPKCGSQQVKIPDVQALHYLIAANLVFKIGPLNHREIGYLIKIIKQKCWHDVDCYFEDFYRSGPMRFRWEGRKWRYLKNSNTEAVTGKTGLT